MIKAIFSKTLIWSHLLFKHFKNFLKKKKFAQPTLPVPVLELAFSFPVIRHSGRHVEA